MKALPTILLAGAALCAVSAAPVNVRVERGPGRLPLWEVEEGDDIRFVNQRAVEAAKHNLPVDGNIEPIGIFWTQIEVGTPLKTHNVAIDTGSSKFLLSLDGCKGCRFSAHSTPFFLNESSTVEPVKCDNPKGCRCEGCFCDKTTNKCNFHKGYETCDLKKPTQPCYVSGELYTDVFGMGGAISKLPTTFGGISAQSANFVQFYDVHGLVGMVDHTNWFVAPNVLDLLAEQKQLPDASFSLCFDNKGGKMTIGGADPNLSTAPLTYTPIVGTFFYNMAVTALQIGRMKVQTPEQVIVDSGTNIFLVPEVTFNAIKGVFHSKYNHLPHVSSSSTGGGWFNGAIGPCYQMDPDELSKFPAVRMTLRDNVQLTMQPSNYLLRNSSFSSPTFCFGIYTSGPGGYFIIGDTFMTNYYAHFDSPNKRIGWAPVNSSACFN